LVHDNLGDALKAQKRFAEAMPHYEAALKLRPDRFNSYFALTSCYAALGRPADAIATAEKEIEKAREHNNAELEAKIRKWIEGYRAHLPGEQRHLIEKQ
jgi:tetratricopeptide (TPR) repeat protein